MTIESGTPRQYAERWGSGEPPARPMPPVAVLTGPRTASAGEAVAIAFRERPGTRTFGEPAVGVPTADAPYPLPDGALVVLTTAREADRTGRVHHGPLRPDVEVERARDSDRVPATATDWLAAHDRCRSP
ncbi:S41 family peptidase [Streptomyces albidoflavus]|uniref:S41 family peptidase n=1 Tax=Streptomyces albidoflavus TaxID=1886 RepID=UPI0033A78804